MALADSVPGVSGGTIAYLLGYYEDFIGALNSFLTLKGSKAERISGIKKSLGFLVKLGIGWGVGFVSAVLILTSVFESHIYQVSSLFIGFILFSIPLIVWEEKQSLKKFYNAFFLLVGAAIVIVMTMVNPSESGGISGGSVSFFQLLYIMLVGMLAISAMVLPGISGSTMLYIFGIYMPVMNSIKDLLHFKFGGLPIVMALGIGIILGIVVIIKFVKMALEKFHSQTVYTIIGLMIGSLFSIVKGPESLDTPKAALSFDSFSIIFFIIGGAVIVGLQCLKLFFGNKKSIKE
ncbi:MAG: DUF368 domain-containing protein [Clostridium sp.]|nr:DUF368 domain-containing protein [Clostridium sp.]MCM1547775.1 DUF368 domain-containing protein [Ruminococcus sp.]